MPILLEVLFYGVLIAVIVTSLMWFRVPVPILTYEQGEEVKDVGEVTAIKQYRPGVYEVSLTQGMNIDPRCLAEPGVVSMSGSFTYFLYFRSWQEMPRIGDRIEALSQNRYFHFTGHSHNWVSSWKHVDEVPDGGLLTVAESPVLAQR